MKQNILKVHPADNVLVALTDLQANEQVAYKGETYIVKELIPAKHKFAIVEIPEGGEIIMYGVLVGKAQSLIPVGGLLSTANVKHAANSFLTGQSHTDWHRPDISKWEGKTFNGYHRGDGSVGTANYWLVIPMVFCENRNIEVLQEALVKPLGYGRKKTYEIKAQELIGKIKAGAEIDEVLYTEIGSDTAQNAGNKVFPNVDGIKFLTHTGGCGGTRQDSTALCGLLAGYITHPNVAGATVLSLGCQNAEVKTLQEEINKRSPEFNKPLYILDQQKTGKEADLMELAIRQTLAGLMQANQYTRKPAPLSKLTIGLECGGSDGFSGISANPAIGYTSDLLVAMGGSVILAEFPELCGVEQNLIDRCLDKTKAERFADLVRTYSQRAEEAGSGFYMNPSPGNIKDGLITDAIKSAGAAKKGGTSPVADVLDYPEKVTQPGLNLLCTPGNDVESTTAEVGSGANIVLFTTGLGTPTGNPIVPVVKIATNTALFNRMSDIIDINTGTIVEGDETIEQAGERILDYVVKVASGEIEVHAVRHGQDDFIPWKRGVSL
ncbi:altronate dehydratase [Mucilaginibacter rubeus]|uniref:Altronate dehydratase n=1 Tax=Mucilaginibacter rubeus TaxID=2027860 RepID=A0AAE6JGK4_9SPHI|nr:altronate dehydratase family protein [Mucilaginibacter rubeus]QEM05294.1 altronate dehydratase [Mucilaginibacter rubeus]QTE45583.1 altronate dehydratase [Mucilaginibacter rubeus]QTE52180.1 altronate dehydratase [Mucilaginibacter rubeus]QTE57268.1 altronate dehydratase [Mucilaginibacter rubeus]QTE63269.1 altronate dehydratase [Mucilaginibacter rubeus]